MSARPSLTLQRRLEAPAAKVFRAFTEPAQLMAWMHPGGTDVVRAQLDVRVHGRFSIVYRKPDGDEVEAAGRYLEVVPERRLVFTWRWHGAAEHEKEREKESETLVTLLLEPDGTGTWLTLTHEGFVSGADCEDHRRGWSDGVDSLERYLA